MTGTDDPAGRVVTRVWRDGELIIPDCPAELMPDFLDEDGYLVWVDLCEPTHEQLARLGFGNFCSTAPRSTFMSVDP